MIRPALGLAAAAALMTAGAAAAQPVTLTFWTEMQEGQLDVVLAREFDEKNEDITVEIRTVPFAEMIAESLRAFATRTNPDVISIDNPDFPAFSSRGAFLAIDDKVAASEVIDPESLFPGPRRSVTWDGKMYGVPRAANTIALYYNRDMFREKGLDPDNPPKTWDELLSAARTLSDPARNVYGIAFSAVANEQGTFQFLPWAQMGGGDYDNIAAPGAVRGLEIWKTLIDEGLASPDTLTRGQFDSTATFNQGNAAMAISGPWELNRMAASAQFDWGVALLPTPEPDSPRSSALGDMNYAVFANSPNPDAAFRLIEYMVSQQHRAWAEFSRMPPRSDVELGSTGNPRIDAAAKVFAEQLGYARNRGPHPEWPRISRIIWTAIQDALTGQSTPQAALEEAAADIARIVN
ncbi:ABC transporter substrate-binding protein [Rubrimonas sp.]|uniref:ABC transporter substrate-binding protein n=1 Tax=Rubrimonas sp. TaxID=2036015 RepID=UPI002FDCB1C7